MIAAVNGWALAGGFETALACDIRIASERAMFGSFEVRRGYHHGDGGIVRLVNTCGSGIALEMLLTGEPIDAQRALQCNLVSKVVPHDRLMEEAELTAQPDPAQQPDRRALGEGDDPRRDRPPARRAAADRGAERLHDAPTPRRRKALLARFYDKTDAGRAGTHETCSSLVKAVVTGAARGIGAAIAAALRERGLDVVTIDLAEGCDHRLDIVARSAARPERRRRLRLQRGDHRHDRARRTG